MTKIDKVVYTAKAHTTGGREGGASRTDDGRLEVRLSTPGAPGTGTNPEQLFADGWSACFLSAIKLAAGKRKICRNPNLSMVVSGPRSDVFRQSAVIGWRPATAVSTWRQRARTEMAWKETVSSLRNKFE